MWIILIFVLSWYSYLDIREKSLPLVWILAGIIISAVLGIWIQVGYKGITIWEASAALAVGMIPGGLLSLLAVVLKGRIGSGDGLVLITIANLVGVQAGIMIWTAAIGLSFLYSCFLLVICKKQKKYCFPFVPFYLLGAVIWYGFSTW